MLPPFDFVARFGPPRVLPDGEEVFDGGSGLRLSVRYGPDRSVRQMSISGESFDTAAAEALLTEIYPHLLKEKPENFGIFRSGGYMRRRNHCGDAVVYRYFDSDGVKDTMKSLSVAALMPLDPGAL